MKKPDARGKSASPPSGAERLIAKWYGTKAARVDAAGLVKNHAALPAPANAVCQGVLGNPEGLRRCKASVHALVARIYESAGGAERASRVVQTCHLGLGMVAVKPSGHDDATFCCGVSLKPFDRTQRRTINEKLAALGIEPAFEGTFDAVRVLEQGDYAQLADLLEVFADELAAKRPRHGVAPRGDGAAAPPLDRVSADTPLRAQLAALEREIIMRGLIRLRWNRARLAKQLGMSRTTLIAKIEEYGLREPSVLGAAAGARALKKGGA